MIEVSFDIKNNILSRVKSHTTIVNIPNGIECIGNEKYMVFTKHSLLEKVILPSSLKKIGTNAFRGCSSLQDISIPDGVTSIGDKAFYGCSSLKKIIIPSSVTEIGNNSFFACNNLQSIMIPTHVTSIGNSTFFGCNKLISINVPERIRIINHGTFGHCINLQSVVLPSNIIRIGSNAFESCNNLQTIKLPEYLEVIESSAFLYCSSLQSVTIPDRVKNIGQSAFWGCSKIKSITFPKSLEILGDCAFFDNKSLQTIVIPPEIKILDFLSCSISGGMRQFTQFEGCLKLNSTARKQLKELGYPGGFNYESRAWMEENYEEDNESESSDEETEIINYEETITMLGYQKINICKPTGVKNVIVIKIDGNSIVAYGQDLGPFPGTPGWVYLSRSKENKEYYYLAQNYLKKYSIIFDILKPSAIEVNCIGKLALCKFDNKITPMITEILSVIINENGKIIKLRFPEQLVGLIEKNVIAFFSPTTNIELVINKNGECNFRLENLIENISKANGA